MEQVILHTYYNEWLESDIPNIFALISPNLSSGSLLWQVYVGTGYNTHPLIGSNGIVYVSKSKLYAIYPSGSLQWIVSVPSPQTPILASNGLIYVGAASTRRMYSVGTLLSTLSPSILPNRGLQGLAPSSKFKGDARNTVYLQYMKLNYFHICFNIYRVVLSTQEPIIIHISE
jgi:hypothetical protein